jgi:hypothetical protein
MNLGDFIKIPEDIKKSYRTESVGFLSTTVKDSALTYQVTAGMLDSFPNANEPPELDYGNIFMDWIETFKSGNLELANEAAEKCFDYEMKVTKKIEHNYLDGSETNVEYCFLADKDNGLMEQSEGKINLINPSTGTVNRFINSGVIGQVDEVYIIGKPPVEYVDRIESMLDTFDKKITRIHPKMLDKEKFYYLSFNGPLGKKYNLKKYVGYFPNYYQCVQNGLCDALYYNDDGVALTYHRKGVELISSQSYGDTTINIYGSDILILRYKGNKKFDEQYSIMHDIYASYEMPFQANIRSGRCNLTNCMVLIGNYAHDRGDIFNSDGDLVYKNTGKNHSCYDLDKVWVPCDGEGRRLHLASYAINMFSGICIYLGKKYRCVESNDDFRDITYNGVFYKYDPGGDVVFVNHEDGKGIDVLGQKVDKLEVVIQPVHLHQFFVDQKYSYGTYHELVYDCYDVGEKVSLYDLLVNVGKKEDVDKPESLFKFVFDECSSGKKSNTVVRQRRKSKKKDKT